MTKRETIKRMRILGRRLRAGQGTEADAAELNQIQNAFYTPCKPARTIFDLDVARFMWSQDAQVEK